MTTLETLKSARKAKRTSAEVCIEYAIAHAAVTEQTRILRDTNCEVAELGEAADWNENYPGMNGTPSCLDELFSAPKGPEHEFPRFQEFYDKMCDPCKVKFAAVEARKDAKRRFGAAKRAVEAIGKREIAAFDEALDRVELERGGL
jgi:hypothetical protein